MITSFVCCTPKNKNTQKDRSDYSFYIEEMDMYIITSKRKMGKYYVMFSQKDTVVPDVEDKIDYILYEIGDMCPINIILNPLNKNEIHIQKETRCILEMNEINNEFVFDYDSYEPKNLKYPFIHLYINSMANSIYIRQDVKEFKIIKEGDIYGGW